MKRMKAFRGTKIATNAEAIALAVEFTDGTQGTIEVMADDAPMLIDVVIAASDALARAQRKTSSFAEGTPGDGSVRTIALPASDLHLVSGDDSSVTLYMRVGLVDLKLTLEPKAAMAISSSLVQMTR